ncbi:MAG: beta-N-acetylglucosaminidase [Marinilabiliales bacterium]|nr:MAG: beta-N-acetylglucosaminidase [Marinilabiliales bacterium]
MNKLFAFVVLTLLFISCDSIKEKVHNPVGNINELGLLPMPDSIVLSDCAFIIKEKLNVNNKGLSSIVQQGLKNFAESNGVEIIKEEEFKKEHCIQFKKNPSLKDEEYILVVDAENITVEASSDAGFFYAIQTLAQLVVTQNSNIIIPGCTIIDKPKFSYRGMHLDVCRHFFDVDFIKKYIDLLAIHKMNRFHWHLTEDQGWRIEIKAFPKLTSIGSKRSETIVEKNFDPYVGDSIPYGGFYTQDEIREVVKYASMRNVTIIPEIEMPGHALAALSAYPELSCTGGPFEVGTKWGVYEDVYCAGNDSVFAFLDKVLDEVCELFPGEFIHIGGDECPKTRWKECEKCQNRIKTEGLKDEHELQSYFIKRIEKYLESKGKHIIGWDEILEGGLAPKATVMSWRGESGGIEAAMQKHQVIMTPNDICYFDHYQREPVEKEPLAICCMTTLEDVYNYNPVPDTLNKEQAMYIIGAQGNVWTEYMKTGDQVEYMVLPRMCALSEVLWGKNSSSGFENFTRRLDVHKNRLKSKGYNCCE